MENKKLLNFKLKILLNELEILELNEIYAEEFSNTYKGKFMEDVAKLSEDNPTTTGDTKDQKSQLKETEIYEVTEEEKQKIKIVYREIAKKCHPDKVIDSYLNNMYMQAHEAYDKNDLLTLYRICQKLNMEIELDQSYIDLLQRIVNVKKQKSVILESSFLWLWVHAKTKEEKETLIIQYINQSKNL